MSIVAELPLQTNDLSYSEDAEHYEIVDGLRVELPPMSVDASIVASDLCVFLWQYGMANNLGKAYTEVLFRLPLPVDRNRRPDVAFVPFDRWPKNRPGPTANAWEVLPDLMVEVISPSDYMDDVLDKLEEYFDAGVRLVWIVVPQKQVVYVYESPKQIKVLSREDELDGGIVLPGFRLPLQELFFDKQESLAG